MSTYRDSFEKCPRCGVELQDAGSARGCAACGGLFVPEGVFADMIQRMLPPGPLARLQLAVLAHGDAPIGCPSCGTVMAQTALHDVPIERCPKLHGVWFDREELQRVLHRTATAPPELHAPEPAHAPPPPAAPRVVPIEPAPVTGPTVHDARTADAPRTLRFLVDAPGLSAPRTVELAREIVKIGRAANAHLRLPDATVARLHAILELTAESAELIDLGSPTRTLVNGTPITKRALEPGDVVQIGIYKLVVAA